MHVTVFFFSSRRRHTRWPRDWSSDVCSSDLTYLSPAEIERLMNHVAHAFNILPEAEVSIEADPRGLTREHIDAARRSGFNRISFGIQDLDPGVQAAIGRIQPLKLVAEVTQWSRAAGFDGISR